MSRRGDARIGWQLLKRNVSNVSILVEDKGYDWDVLRHKLHAEGVKTAIKYREFDPFDAANNALLDDMNYAQRANVESVFFALRE